MIYKIKLTHSNILYFLGNHLLYDTGTSGLMAASLMNAIGASTTGHLIHMHPGNDCQKNAFLAMQFPKEQANRCINVNIYSVLRCYYQNKNSYSENSVGTLNTSNSDSNDSCSKEIDSFSKSESSTIAKINTDDCREDFEPSEKKIKLDESIQKKPWQLDNERACKLMEKKIDSVIITSKEHPVTIATELLSFLNNNRNLVVFNLLREPLQDLYFYLKSRTDIVNIRLMSSFVRNYQVLPGRTHPEVNMTNGGYILAATKVNS